MCKYLFMNLFQTKKKWEEHTEGELINLCPIDVNTLQRLLSGLTEKTALNCDSVEIRPVQDWTYLDEHGVVVYFANEHKAQLTEKGRFLYNELKKIQISSQKELHDFITQEY